MAFPTTGVLESGSGVNEDPIETNWDGTPGHKFFAGDTGQLAKISNQITNATGGGTDTSSAYDATQFLAGNIEVWATIVTASAVTGDQFKVAFMNAFNDAAADGYELHVEKSAGTDIWRIRRRDNVTPMQLGVDMNQEIASGDSVGLQLISGVLSAYYKPGAGAWTLVGQRSDSTYTGPWWIGIKTAQASPLAWKTVPFGGGTALTTTVPTVPQSLTATGGDSQVTLSWSAPTSDGGSAITAYKIYRGQSAGTETLYASPAGTGTTYTDSAAVNGTPYYYKVTAVNAVGESALSNEASATPLAAAAPVRTFKRLYGPTLLGNAASTFYTCPVSTIAVIRHVHVSNPSGANVDFSLSIGTSAAGTRIWDAQPIPADDLLDHYQDFALAAGEIIQGFAGSAATLNLTIDGYEQGDAAAAAGPIYPSDTLFPSETSP
jgi:hypothetical protein